MKDVNVLIVEDEQDIREFLTFCLKESFKDRFNVHVEETIDGTKGLEKSKNIKFDLIITDLQMPLMDGETFIHALKSDNTKNQDTPVIIISAKAIIESDPENLVYIMKKPFDLERLEKVMKIALGPNFFKSAA